MCLSVSCFLWFALSKKNCTNAFFIPTPPIHKRTYEFNLLDIVCLGGHTEADETKEEEVLHKLNRRASFINPADLASLGLQRAPDLVKPETLSDEGSPREDYAEPSQKSSSGGGGGGTAVQIANSHAECQIASGEGGVSGRVETNRILA